MNLVIWLAGALAAEPEARLMAEREVVVLEPAPIGSTVDVVLPYTTDGDDSGSYSVNLTNLEGGAFRFGSEGDTLELLGGGGQLQLAFAPTSPGRYRAEVEVDWPGCAAPAKVEVRGSAYAPCLVASPRVMDWGRTVPPDADLHLLQLRSCDAESVTIDSALTDNSRFTVGAPMPLTVTTVGIQITVQFQPLGDEPQRGTLTLAPHGITVDLVANDCENGNPANWDSNGDGTSDCGFPVGGMWEDGDGDGFAGVDGDCDDDAAGIFPGATEVDGGQDDDCDGSVDEHLDADADGTPAATDCDDADPFAGVGEVEVLDGVDNDCDGAVDDGVEPAACDDAAGADGSGCGCASGPGGATGAWLAVGLAALRRRRS